MIDDACGTADEKLWKSHFCCFNPGLLVPAVSSSEAVLACSPHDVLVHVGGEVDVQLSLRYYVQFVDKQLTTALLYKFLISQGLQWYCGYFSTVRAS